MTVEITAAIIAMRNRGETIEAICLAVGIGRTEVEKRITVLIALGKVKRKREFAALRHADIKQRKEAGQTNKFIATALGVSLGYVTAALRGDAAKAVAPKLPKNGSRMRDVCRGGPMPEFDEEPARKARPGLRLCLCGCDERFWSADVGDRIMEQHRKVHAARGSIVIHVARLR